MYRAYVIYTVNNSKELVLPFVEGNTEQECLEQISIHGEKITDPRINIIEYRMVKVA